MKLKDDMITHDIDGTQFIVPVGADAFSGVVRSNKTTADRQYSEKGLQRRFCDTHSGMAEPADK